MKAKTYINIITYLILSIIVINSTQAYIFSVDNTHCSDESSDVADYPIKPETPSCANQNTAVKHPICNNGLLIYEIEECPYGCARIPSPIEYIMFFRGCLEKPNIEIIENQLDNQLLNNRVGTILTTYNEFLTFSINIPETSFRKCNIIFSKDNETIINNYKQTILDEENIGNNYFETYINISYNVKFEDIGNHKIETHLNCSNELTSLNPTIYEIVSTQDFESLKFTYEERDFMKAQMNATAKALEMQSKSLGWVVFGLFITIISSIATFLYGDGILKDIKRKKRKSK